MLAESLVLRFDGSHHMQCGGAGAILMASERVVWEGGRFLARCPSSTAAEYEGLILGLEAAASHEPHGLHIEGDCRVVLAQAQGRSRARKSSKLHARAASALERLTLSTRPTFGSIPRADNFHADALSRAAVDAARRLHGGVILGAARTGQLQPALRSLEHATRDGVPLDAPEFYDELMRLCHDARDWHSLLSVFREGRRRRGHAARSELAYALAIEALEALGGSARGSNPASRQLAELQRELSAAHKRAASRALHGDPSSRAPEGEVHGVETKDRSAAASAWLAWLESEAGGAEALRGDDVEATPRLLALAERLASEQGLGLSAVS